MLAVVLLFGGCAVAPPASDPEAVAEFKELNDPGEPLMRAIFEFNRGLDRAFLKPVAKVYRDSTPQFFQNRINHVLGNLRAPVIFINDALQGELDRALVTLVRFMINSTWGLLGLNDLATDMGMPGHDEDFGQTLAVWGMKEGPYLMLPLFGPSNPRDAIGLAVDYLINPFNIWTANTDRQYAAVARTGVGAVDLRALHMEILDELEKSSLDFYASIRSLYRQRRGNEISNGDPSANLPVLGFNLAPVDPLNDKGSERFDGGMDEILEVSRKR
ncbi:MAG: VacJ family lipoprotein [Rhodospirillales bacterium]|nr:VacJ family lipoprotein [Rhodospirillales bacterium]